MERRELGKKHSCEQLTQPTKIIKEKETDKEIELLGQEYDSCNWEDGGVLILGLQGVVGAAFQELYDGCFCRKEGRNQPMRVFMTSVDPWICHKAVVGGGNSVPLEALEFCEGGFTISMVAEEVSSAPELHNCSTGLGS